MFFIVSSAQWETGARGIQAGLATQYFLRLAMVVFIVIFVLVNAYPFCSVFLENPGSGVGLVAI